MGVLHGLSIVLESGFFHMVDDISFAWNVKHSRKAIAFQNAKKAQLIGAKPFSILPQLDSIFLVRPAGFEPATYGFEERFSEPLNFL
jgi:hypothetical protein